MKERKVSTLDKTPIVAYYQYGPPKDPKLNKIFELQKNQQFIGKHVWTFIDEEYGTKKHLIVTEQGKISIKGCRSLDGQLETLKKGANVRILYKGKGKAKKGQRPPYLWDVFEIMEPLPFVVSEAAGVKKQKTEEADVEDTQDEAPETDEAFDDEVPF